MEKSYVEIKVSFLHIVVLLVGVIIIGSFLFFLGYQAGKSSSKNQMLKFASKGKAEKIQLVDEKDKIPVKKQMRKEPSIGEEIKLHRQPPKDKIKTKTFKKEPYYSIQVGAFSEYVNAKNYSAKFANMGYPTEILTTVKKNKKFFRVRVGNFKTRAEAKREKVKLEKMEKGKFEIIKSG